MNNIVRAGKNAIFRAAPRAIQRASRAVARVAGDEAALRAELAGSFATVLATVGAFMSPRRARRVLEIMERNPELSFAALLRRFAALEGAARDLAEAEARRMIADLGDALETDALLPMLRAIRFWTVEGLIREECVSVCRLLRDLDRPALDKLRAGSEPDARRRELLNRLFA